jgi:ketosteroid isomerase-like protein
MSTIETVQGIYEAFGKGDVGAIVERVADDVEWEYGAVDNGVPWLTPGRGRDHVVRFFQTVGAELDFKAFQVVELVGNQRLVAAVVALECVVRRTGNTLREAAEVHLWHFDDRGRVIKFRHAADTHGHRVALGLA